MNNKITAYKFYKHFSNTEGNQHIAGLFAIETILNLVERYSPQNILELGLGIGSVSYSVIEFSKKINLKMNYYGTEKNIFCLEELPKNLENKFNHIRLFSEAKDLPRDIKFDFIIIDGSDDSLKSIKNSVSERAIIYIEGYRISQVNLVKSFFPRNKYVSVISGYKNPNFGPFDKKKWSGGGQLIFVNPTFYQRAHYLYLKVLTSFKYKVLRKLNKFS
ncbi:hypothetical protein [Tamlana sp. I1]|uniref:hypothetical protein n=1 Tax=Tamlana sp. I1 TaxID=2762061 RepID=UPI00188E4C97|nr:hypothetical protein [Tamlana sp. I1]